MSQYYLIEFKSNDAALHAAGFEICLALTTLDLPLNILLSTIDDDTNLRKQLASLDDYGFATLYDKKMLTENQYEQLMQTPHFSLCF